VKFNFKKYSQLLKEYNVNVLYSGPIWAGGIDGMAEMLQRRLDFDDLPLSASQSVFSVFVEQMNNMLMYSAEKELFESSSGKNKETSIGIFILGIQGKKYFIQTRNVVSENNMEILKERIDLLNTMDKKELRQYFKEQAKAENENPESKGAGLGLIEIARRASSGIEYEFSPFSEGFNYFSMYVSI